MARRIPAARGTVPATMIRRPPTVLSLSKQDVDEVRAAGKGGAAPQTPQAPTDPAASPAQAPGADAGGERRARRADPRARGTARGNGA